MTKLVICEKPSVVKSIASVLGAREREDGCISCEQSTLAFSMKQIF